MSLVIRTPELADTDFVVAAAEHFAHSFDSAGLATKLPLLPRVTLSKSPTVFMMIPALIDLQRIFLLQLHSAVEVVNVVWGHYSTIGSSLFLNRLGNI